MARVSARTHYLEKPVENVLKDYASLRAIPRDTKKSEFNPVHIVRAIASRQTFKKRMGTPLYGPDLKLLEQPRPDGRPYEMQVYLNTGGAAHNAASIAAIRSRLEQSVRKNMGKDFGVFLETTPIGQNNKWRLRGLTFTHPSPMGILHLHYAFVKVLGKKGEGA